jgi:SPP1 family predicted phage head-tail adaptor
MAMIEPGMLDRRITFQRQKVVAAEAEASDDAGSKTWEKVATVWAQVQDVLPSRGEKVADGVTLTNRPARVRLWFRTDITGDMRILFGTRILQIIAGPVELGRREGLELMAEETSSPGEPA